MMSMSVFKLPRAVSFVFLFVLAACETPVDDAKLPDMTFTHLPRLQINVASVEIDDRYKPPLKSPNVEHTLVNSPASVLRRWATDRLNPVGVSDIARLIITDAAVTETALKKDTSFTGTFTKQQSHRYDFSVAATLEIVGSAGIRKAFAAANASRSQTTREDMSVAEREKIMFGITEKLMRDFNAEMEKNIRRHLVTWLK